MRESRVFFLVIMVCLIAFWPAPNTRAAEYEEVCHNANLNAKVTGYSSVKLSWKKRKSVKTWHVKKILYSKNGSFGPFKNCKTVKKGNNSCLLKGLKKNRYYSFLVEGRCKAKGKIHIYQDQVYICTGWATPNWDDYVHEWPYSTTSITLKGQVDAGMAHQGFEIYRKAEGAAKYKRIKVIKTKKASFTYKDTSLSNGKTYRYKFRTYGKYKKKKCRSAFSEAVIKTACNPQGDYAVSLVESTEESFVILVNAAQYNGNLQISPDADLRIFATGQPFYEDEFSISGAYARMAGWSRDMVSWDTGPALIRAQETVYLRVEYTPTEIINKDSLGDCYFGAISDQSDVGLRYNRTNASMWFAVNGNGIVTMDNGYYH